MMFTQEYCGLATKDFIASLDIYRKIYDPSQHFGRIIPIVQSSGTGKSRLLVEVNETVRLPFNFYN